jgi:hypothetical protein
MTSSGFETIYRELCSILAGPDTPRSIRQDFLRLVDGPNKFVAIEVHAHPALRTNDSSLTLEASDLLVGLLTAARAGDWEKVAILQHEALTPDLVAQSG